MLSLPNRRQSKQGVRVCERGATSYPQPLHSCFSCNPPLGEIKLSPNNFIYDVVLPHSPLHFDSNICTRTGLLNIFILNLH
jgi:hypothetical protein